MCDDVGYPYESTEKDGPSNKIASTLQIEYKQEMKYRVTLTFLWYVTCKLKYNVIICTM